MLRTALSRSCASALAQRRFARQVAFIDGKFLFTPLKKQQYEEKRKPGTPAPYVVLELPDKLHDDLASAEEHMSTMEDPGNTWTAGEAAEVHEYDYVGRHTARSGIVCAVDASVLEEALPGGERAFDRMRDMLFKKAGSAPAPILFGGRVVGADATDIYVLRRNAEAVGVMVAAAPADE